LNVNYLFVQKIAKEAGFNSYNYMGCNAALFQKFTEMIIEGCVDIAYARGDNVDYLKNYVRLNEKLTKDVYDGEIK